MYKEVELKNGEILTLREASTDDAGEIIKYQNTIISETDFMSMSTGEFQITIEEEKNILTKFLENPNELYLISEIDGKIIGVVTISSTNRQKHKHVGNLGISVLQEHWGKGIGSILLEEGILRTKENGIIKRLELKVFSNNKRAIALYKKFGFEHEGTLKNDVFIDGEYSNSEVMGLLIENL